MVRAMRRTLEPEVMDTADDAEEYDAMDFNEPDTRFADAAVILLGAAPGGRVLDVGTGTAKIPVLLLARRPDVAVLAVDMADQMLRVAAQNLARAGLDRACTLAKMDAKALAVAAASFDLVLSNSLAHHLPEPLDLFRELARVVKPAGGVLVRDLIRPESEADARALVSRYGSSDSARQKQLFFDSLCAALTLDEVREMVKTAAIEGATVVRASDRHWSVERMAG
jgi:ubiquinone/menaquinone biosynthesis C-methylase UbiE